MSEIWFAAVGRAKHFHLKIVLKTNARYPSGPSKGAAAAASKPQKGGWSSAAACRSNS